MENERTENIFYLDLKHVHKYGCAKFQPNPLFSSPQMATEGAAEKKTLTSGKKRTKRKKSRQPLKGIPSADGMPQLLVARRYSEIYPLGCTIKQRSM